MTDEIDFARQTRLSILLARTESDGTKSEGWRGAVAFLSHLWPSHLTSPARRNLAHQTMVCLHSPVGQLAWGIDAEDPLFAHLRRDGTCIWDGHRIPERNARLTQLLTMLDGREPPAG